MEQYSITLNLEPTAYNLTIGEGDTVALTVVEQQVTHAITVDPLVLPGYQPGGENGNAVPNWTTLNW